VNLAKFQPDVAGALSRLGKPRAEIAFPIPTAFHVRRAQEMRRAKPSNRAFIRPENARAVLPHLPRAEGDRLHAIICGNFVFCDLLTAIAWESPGLRLAVATLSFSRRNIDSLILALDAGHLSHFEIILSHYFKSTSKDLFTAMERDLRPRPDCRIAVGRTHCKVALLSGPALPVPIVIESSANLRSSGNLEQISAFADTALHAFHRATFDLLLANTEAQP
jgi:hypothetical protein